MTEDLRDIHTRSTGTALALHEYELRDLLAFFQRHGLRKATFPVLPRDRARLRSQELIEALRALTEQGLLRSGSMGRQCGPFKIEGFSLTMAGEIRLEALQGKDPQQVDLRFMLQLLQQANAAKGPWMPFLPHSSPERVTRLVAEHLEHRNLVEAPGGKVIITAQGRKTQAIMEGLSFKVPARSREI